MLWCVDTMCEPPMPPCPSCGLGHVQWVPSDVEESIWVGGLGYFLMFLLSCDHWPHRHSLLDGPSEVLWLSNNNGEIVHPGVMTCGVGMVIYGEGDMECSLSLSPKVLADPPIYSISHPNLLHIYPYITPLFCVMLSFRTTRRPLMVLPPLEMDLNSHFTTNVFKLSLNSFV